MNKLVRAFEREGNLTLTENLAVTHASTLDKVLDFFYHAPARQGEDNLPLFLDAWKQDPTLALKALFYIRDVREGKGQKKTFRDILLHLAKKEKMTFDQLVPFIPEYGSWKDLTPLVAFRVVQKLVGEVFKDDLSNVSEGLGVSLLAKWMPSENATSQETKELARRWMQVLDLTPKQYRQSLSVLREKINVVERLMSAGKWDEIVYEQVPARAMKQYKNAYQRHDKTRFDRLIEKVIASADTGEIKIKAGTVYPHEIIAEVRRGKYTRATEAQWLSLPNYFGEEERRVLVVVDTSGSMFAPIGRSNSNGIQAIDVSVGLGMYCAERNKGAFQNYMLTFNSDSELVKIEGKTLQERFAKASRLDWGGSTNLMSAFQSILDMAIDNEVPEEDMPTDILIISDMEFNAVGDRDTNLERAKKLYKKAGYTRPRVTFWNVNSRNNQVPATRDEDSVLLVSGFSAETIGKVLNTRVATPIELMLEVLNSERYAFVDQIV